MMFEVTFPNSKEVKYVDINEGFINLEMALSHCSPPLALTCSDPRISTRYLFPVGFDSVVLLHFFEYDGEINSSYYYHEMKCPADGDLTSDAVIARFNEFWDLPDGYSCDRGSW